MHVCMYVLYIYICACPYADKVRVRTTFQYFLISELYHHFAA